MPNTLRASTARLPRRLLVSGAALAWGAALLSAGGCGSEDTGPSDDIPQYSGNGLTPLTGTGGTANASANTGGTSSAVSAAVLGGGPGIGPSGEGGNVSALAGAAGVSSAGAGTSPVSRPCVDAPPPFNPEWPDATCESWATATDECSASWFAAYCDVSCGRCIPEGGSTLPQAPDCSGEGLPNVTGGEGYTTRYWDCCQTHCSQFDGRRCGQDGVSRTGDSNSACTGGSSFACYDEAPRAVSECLSYGHIAKADPNCGACYRIQFTGEGQYNPNDIGSTLLEGKQMIVKVTNTGSDVNGNQFDLMIPGGGVGMFNACSRQWGTNDLGAQFGGFLTECTGTHAARKECVRQECMKIPAGSARNGCLWFVDWFQIADNPKFTSQATSCPF